MEDANEVQEALSRSYGTPEIDEDDLEAGTVYRTICHTSLDPFRVNGLTKGGHSQGVQSRVSLCLSVYTLTIINNTFNTFLIVCSCLHISYVQSRSLKSGKTFKYKKIQLFKNQSQTYVAAGPAQVCLLRAKLPRLLYSTVLHWPAVFSELDALGDELLLDDDSSYLDEASAAPSIPEGMPSDSKTNKVTVYGAHHI